MEEGEVPWVVVVDRVIVIAGAVVVGGGGGCEAGRSVRRYVADDEGVSVDHLADFRWEGEEGYHGSYARC